MRPPLALDLEAAALRAATEVNGRFMSEAGEIGVLAEGRAADERPAQGPFGVPHLHHEALDTLESQADPESPALGECRDCVAVGEPVAIGHPVSPRRPRRRRSR